ncbi:integrase catalytic domain-containing protein [Trichonephila clavipes]|nr:integrase catalytic domain-containing protein [Trichonephila clavipes]
MREIKADGSGVAFYMPHHGVIALKSSTTKLRTVLNASRPSTSGKSLSSIQFNGGLVQEDLFPLWFASESTTESIELHVFSDASEKAYGSSIYLKSIFAFGEVKMCLITSKSRVSPLKQISIPRLELCGAVLVAKLIKKVKNALKLQISLCIFGRIRLLLFHGYIENQED